MGVDMSANVLNGKASHLQASRSICSEEFLRIIITTGTAKGDWNVAGVTATLIPDYPFIPSKLVPQLWKESRTTTVLCSSEIKGKEDTRSLRCAYADGDQSAKLPLLELQTLFLDFNDGHLASLGWDASLYLQSMVLFHPWNFVAPFAPFHQTIMLTWSEATLIIQKWPSGWGLTFLALCLQLLTTRWKLISRARGSQPAISCCLLPSTPWRWTDELYLCQENIPWISHLPLCTVTWCRCRCLLIAQEKINPGLKFPKNKLVLSNLGKDLAQKWISEYFCTL